MLLLCLSAFYQICCVVLHVCEPRLASWWYPLGGLLKFAYTTCLIMHTSRDICNSTVSSIVFNKAHLHMLFCVRDIASLGFAQTAVEQLGSLHVVFS